MIEEHPLGFFIPENAKILMLGSFPPKKERWSINFYYPNIQNDMWRIMGLIFYGNKEHFVIKAPDNRPSKQSSVTTSKLNKTEIAKHQIESTQDAITQEEYSTQKDKVAKSKGRYKFNEELIREFCIEKGIALGDTAVKVKRLKNNASDKFLEIVEHLDIANILKQIPNCHTIIVTGEKAMETLLYAINNSNQIAAANSISEQKSEITAPKVGEHTVISFSTTQPYTQENQQSYQPATRQIKLYRMPSSSRAYPKPVEEKAAYYRTALI